MIEREILSRAENPTLFINLTSIVDVLDINSFFPRKQPLEIELGAGDGTFIVQYARLHPEHNFLAVERLLGRARKVEKKALRYGLENLRVIRIEASYFAQYLIPQSCVAKLHIYFPDPWPKPRHAKNRLIQPPFIETLKKIMQPQGEVFLRTDSVPYHEQMARVFSQFKEFVPIETPQDLKDIKTDFEQEFLAQGIQTLHLAYKFNA
ncbi:MAG: tRNA (guanosine(46)-N7)-methyltransferase TrmB [Verrucomicrobiae bacterium]|nr:tRNA (guanosine(46)-N7)-methyltransferase TrmB [Verrucomicrobiae bacterium]